MAQTRQAPIRPGVPYSCRPGVSARFQWGLAGEIHRVAVGGRPNHPVKSLTRPVVRDTVASWPAASLLVLSALAGCLLVEDDASSAPTRSNAIGTHPGLPGVRVFVNITHDEDEHHVEATAVNEGSRSYKVRGLCEPPWTERLQDEGGRAFQGGEPTFHCEAIRWDDFAPGSRLPYESWWNETRWDSSRERVEPAERGSYIWTIAFRAAEAEDEPESTIPVDLDVVVD